MSEELVPASSNEFLDQLVTTVSKNIAEGRIAQEEAIRERKIENAIARHYNELARTTLETLWKECKKQTKHKAVNPRTGSGYPVCAYCAKPLSSYGSSRKERKLNLSRRENDGIINVAEQLRQADRRAGIEWKPNWIK